MEISSSIFIPPTTLGRQDGEGETSGKGCFKKSCFYRVFPNSTDTFRGVIVGSMGMTNHHRSRSRKARLVGVIRPKNSYEGCDVVWNEKRQ
ncbi:hypothetical protein TNCV_1734351 [Trichonephila clavipes]|nr:hypothetical protein TNCV_1734351 [Trichonephila clavipes]